MATVFIGTLADVEQLHHRFKKTFGFAVTANQFESLLLLKSAESVGTEEVFEVLNANHDGRVDGLELLAALVCVCRAMFEDKARCTAYGDNVLNFLSQLLFDLFDFNHNGSLSLAELALLMTLRSFQAPRLMAAPRRPWASWPGT
ncbi:hypothetical protein PPTG_21985 [Phytophthora nicotianae INRA-310]|uniref:EF-hand domain-containing protein n=1 Tax=Phytophthora nicotianae (strain INRA-310) TaxID=761204 RepID=W2QR92_PHYN3|nr:hypothetical protein PPTG_21985 [Phytophthora nicotianae INRA-310]ETN15717.1 hypothetical protein PPTG_21985 [Phytophthora nicotianae INRA-310]